MKRIAVTTLVLALTVAAGGAVAAYQDYGNNPSYDSRNDNYSANDPRYYNDGDPRGNYNDPRYAESAYRANSRNDIAQVVGVQPLYGQYGAYQRQECWNEQTNVYDNGYYRDGNGNLYRGDSNADGALLGAIIGGALGNQVGHGNDKTAATISGAVIGGAIGNSIDRNNNSAYDQYRGPSGVVTRCRTVSDYNNNRSINGYNVTYRYAGQTYHTVTSYRPGRNMPVRVSVMPQGSNTAYRY